MPDAEYTFYGKGKEELLLKYFFILPQDDFYALNHFLNIEQTQNGGIFWEIDFFIDSVFQIKSNLQKSDNHKFTGFLNTDPEILITPKKYETLTIWVDDQAVELDLGYEISSSEKQALLFFLPYQFNFIKEKTGGLPKKIFLSRKNKQENDFFGNDDIRFWKFIFQLFSDSEKYDLDYFSLISNEVVNSFFITDKEKQHWLKNGIKTYLEMSYISKNYAEKKLIGDLPETISLWGIKPLKIFYVSDLLLLTRYGLAYQYMYSEFSEQKIAEDFSKLSNLNHWIISSFTMGSLFDFVAESMGRNDFDDFLKKYIKNYQNEKINHIHFLESLSLASGGDSDFLREVMELNRPINFKIKKIKKEGNFLDIYMKSSEKIKIPLKITLEKEKNEKENIWLKKQNENHYLGRILNQGVKKIELNSGYVFPEKSYRDNYIYTKGIFSNMRKPRFKFLKDIPNPEYNELYLNPQLDFNAYDGILLGMNFKNTSLFNQNFVYSLTPYYSTKIGQFTGSGAVGCTFRPDNQLFRSFYVSAGASAFHYDYDLGYKKVSFSMGGSLRKNPRSSSVRNFGISYHYFQKDLTPEMILRNDYDQYHLWNVFAGYANGQAINELGVSGNFQMMKDFAKISFETFYRREYSKNKKILFRLFAGYFFNNNTRNDMFDYGISKISNYSFSFGLLGQSATSGLLAQQFILAEAGFKSHFPTRVNGWLLAQNTDAHIYKMFNIYADWAIYQNKNHHPRMIWDSGVKVKVVPDFFEIYFPIYSTLGFEVAQPQYFSKIRYSLVLNLSAVIAHFRRGWY